MTGVTGDRCRSGEEKERRANFIEQGMINLLYCNINELEDEQIDPYLQLLPDRMRKEISGYRFASDRKARILARHMLRKSLLEGGNEGLLEHWESGINKKPFIKGWDHFNITHSGEMVVFCHSENPIGIDIEQLAPVDHAGISDYFTREEKDRISAAVDPQKAFYEIWVKKESFLKAVGIGLGVELDSFHCLGDEIFFEGVKYFFMKQDLVPGYMMFVCTTEENADLKTGHFLCR